ncbi:MAG TPA: universal stress protein [Desulfonatronum sp.]|nr:universal stress protein [Desulfonatronum sp.]
MNFKKILVAVDASENSARAVEYTGIMIGQTPGFQIHLLYVERHPERDIFPDDASWKNACQEEEQNIRDFLAQARGMLENKGVQHEAISVDYASSGSCSTGPQRSSKGHSVANHILKVHQEGGYGTVVVGRRGVSKAEEFLFGSVTTKIIHNAKDCTVWVVE